MHEADARDAASLALPPPLAHVSADDSASEILVAECVACWTIHSRPSEGSQQRKGRNELKQTAGGKSDEHTSIPNPDRPCLASPFAPLRREPVCAAPSTDNATAQHGERNNEKERKKEEGEGEGPHCCHPPRTPVCPDRGRQRLGRGAYWISSSSAWSASGHRSGTAAALWRERERERRGGRRKGQLQTSEVQTGLTPPFPLSRTSLSSTLRWPGAVAQQQLQRAACQRRGWA